MSQAALRAAADREAEREFQDERLMEYLKFKVIFRENKVEPKYFFTESSRLFGLRTDLKAIIRLREPFI